MRACHRSVCSMRYGRLPRRTEGKSRIHRVKVLTKERMAPISVARMAPRVKREGSTVGSPSFFLK